MASQVLLMEQDFSEEEVKMTRVVLMFEQGSSYGE